MSQVNPACGWSVMEKQNLSCLCGGPWSGSGGLRVLSTRRLSMKVPAPSSVHPLMSVLQSALKQDFPSRNSDIRRMVCGQSGCPVTFVAQNAGLGVGVGLLAGVPREPGLQLSHNRAFLPSSAVL